MSNALLILVYSSNLLSLKQTSVGDLGLSFSITNNDMGERQVSSYMISCDLYNHVPVN